MKQTAITVSINNNINNKMIRRNQKRPKSVRLLAGDEEVLDEADDIIGDELERLNYPTRFCYTPKEIAKIFGIETADLNSFLKDQGIIVWEHGRWYLTQDFKNKDLATDRYKCVHSDDGQHKFLSYLVWTPNGKQFITDIIYGHLKVKMFLEKYKQTNN